MQEIDRRTFLAALTIGLVALPLVVEAPPSDIPRIGVIAPGSPTPGTFPIQIFDSFRQGLRELGYVEDRTIVIESSWEEGRPDRNTALVDALIRLNVNIIVATTTAAPAAASVPVTAPAATTIGAEVSRSTSNLQGV